MVRLLLAGLLALLCTVTAQAEKLLEPALHIPHSADGHPHIAITLDACSGNVDHRILDVLVQQSIPATIFVTRRWLVRNAETVAIMIAHPDLFDIEDHGRDHVPAVTGTEKPYGIKPAGTLAAVDDEVNGGEAAIALAFGKQAKWFRGATALYSPDAIDEIHHLGYQVAGFSLNADLGASVSTKTAAARLESAKDGDVIIAHINQPKRSSGAGIAAGLLDLKRRGYDFLRLSDVAAS
ncbi:MAG: polysaccharide deacetylase [Devosia sp.]|uniref:polysaccharide deacetylase family protein n=1 Tax=Devosia sp. TaxID=1871048 RepID=UPI00260C63DD|nr:polysaccharide deacetylase family protein [Devosia sp.]MDB5587679.1 polysaccharide deacetylase [Devosia sp.]